MGSETVRIHPDTHAKLKQLAEGSGGADDRSALAKAVEAYHRRAFLESLNRGFAAPRADPRPWDEQQAERKLWEATLADGLED